MKYNPQDEGFIALVSVIAISLILTLLVVTASSHGYSARFNILNSEMKEISYQLARVCSLIALRKIEANPNYTIVSPVEIAAPFGNPKNCRIISLTQIGIGQIKIVTQAEQLSAYSTLSTVA